MIVKGEEGLDMRFASGGNYGIGIYFANNSIYSANYAYVVPQARNDEYSVEPGVQLYQILLCFVIQGNGANIPHPDQSLRMPPLVHGPNG